MFSRLYCSHCRRSTRCILKQAISFRVIRNQTSWLSVPSAQPHVSNRVGYVLIGNTRVPPSKYGNKRDIKGLATFSSNYGIFQFSNTQEKAATVEKVFEVEDGDIDNFSLTQSTPGGQVSAESTDGEIIDSIAANSDAIMQFSDYGLGGGILPHKIFQDVLNFLTTNLELEWIPAIAILTIFLRFLTLPGMIAMRRFSVRSHNLFPETMKLMQNMQDAKMSGNTFLAKKYMMEYMSHLNNNKLSPFRALFLNSPNAVIFMSMFYGIRQICTAKLPALTTGGVLWFHNLAIPDPYFILPICSCLSMSMLIRSGGAEAEMGAMGSVESFRKILMLIPLVSLPFFVLQPSAMFAFWIVSNTFTFGSMLLFRNKSFTKFCGIPERVKHDKVVTEALSKAYNPLEIIKKAKQHQKEQQELAAKIKNYQDTMQKMQEYQDKGKK